MYTNLNNPANYQLQDFGQFGFRVLDSSSMVVDGETYRTLYVLDDAVVSATSAKADDLVSKALLAGTLLHGLFSAPSVTSGKVLAYMAGRLTAQEILDLYKAYLDANGGKLELESETLSKLQALGTDDYADASLVLMPSGYKTSVLFSERPMDTDGQIAFTRASNATRVDANGLVEKVRTNLALYSEDLTNGAYVAQNATITANTSVAPDGTTTADTYNEGTVSSVHRFFQQLTITANQECGFSFYAKKNTLDNIRLVVNDVSQNYRWFGAQFDLTNGTITATATGSLGGATYIGGSITSADNGWYRCSVNGTINATTALCFVHSSTSTAITSSDDRGGISYAGTSRTYFGWGFQFETGVTTDYIPTTTSARSTFAGITVDGTSVPNVPRLDYSGGASCPSLLLEPQRTNSATYSEQFDNAAWIKFGGATVTANTLTSPDGYTNADTLNIASGQEIYSNMGSKAASAIAYTFSCFAKYNSAAVFRITASDFTTSATTASFNLQTGVATFSQGATWSNTSVKMENYGNGWYRCIMTTTTPTTTGLYVSLLTQTSGSVYIYGMQTEAGAYATSYIGPTLGSAVTRVAESCSNTSATSIIGQTEGTFYAEVEVIGGISNVGFYARNPSGGLYGELMVLYFNADKYPTFEVRTGNMEQAFIRQFTAYSNGIHKIAGAYKANDFVLYVDGVQVGSDTSGSIPALSQLYLGNYIDGGVRNHTKKQALLFKTRLTNAQLAELTTL